MGGNAKPDLGDKRVQAPCDETEPPPMTTPPPSSSPYPPQQPYLQQPTGGYPQPDAQATQQHYYPQPGHAQGYQQPQYPPPYSVPSQQGLPAMPPPKKKPRFGLGARIGMIIGAVVVIVVIANAGNSGSSSTTPTATGTTTSGTAQTPAATAPTAAPAPPAPAKAITARDWAKIAKDPNSHVGESIIVYGEITQFDSVTGSSAFRADVDGVKHPVEYGYANYETNTMLAVNGAAASDLVEKDLFRAEAVVTGSLSYETTMGGTMTVPQLSVQKITKIGMSK
jgi:hypothetical protein